MKSAGPESMIEYKGFLIEPIEISPGRWRAKSVTAAGGDQVGPPHPPRRHAPGAFRAASAGGVRR